MSAVIDAPPRSADAAVQQAFEGLRSGAVDAARSALAWGVRAHPDDSRFQVLSAALAQAEGKVGQAFQHLWWALAAEPASALARAEVLNTVVVAQADPARVTKNFALTSGERQTAAKVEQIRADHRARYAFAARWIRAHFADVRRRVGLDVFCGSGYGSRMLAQQAGVRMVGLDGSAEAVALAEASHGSHRAVFGHALFPFELQGPLFDFAVSFESIEHVDDPLGLLQQMARASDGPFIVSVPNEAALPFASFGHRFEHHVRHFTRDAILDLLRQVGRTRILEERGQQVYTLAGRTLTGLVPPARMGLMPVTADAQFLVLVVGTD